MAMVTAGTAKNAVMILQRTANTPNDAPIIAAYMRGTHYSFERVYVSYYSAERGYIYKDSSTGPMAGSMLSQNNSAAVPAFQRITLSDSLIKVEMFTTQPGVTGGTPTFTLTSTNSDYLVSGAWQYNNTYASLVSFTTLDVTNYTVTYNANGGSVTPASAVYSGTPLTLPTPTRADYTFNGWYTATTGGTLVNSPYTPTANITLYAQWTQNKVRTLKSLNAPVLNIQSLGVDAQRVYSFGVLVWER